jgi:hypothetical protein
MSESVAAAGYGGGGCDVFVGARCARKRVLKQWDEDAD